MYPGDWQGIGEIGLIPFDLVLNSFKSAIRVFREMRQALSMHEKMYAGALRSLGGVRVVPFECISKNESTMKVLREPASRHDAWNSVWKLTSIDETLSWGSESKLMSPHLFL